MLDPVAAVHDPDRALRALIRRALGAIGFITVESESPAQLALVLSTSSLVIAQRALVILPQLVAEACHPSLAALGRRRADCQLPPLHILKTREFCAPDDQPCRELPGCASVGYLEKPFDFGSIQEIAERCRALEPVAAVAVSGHPR